MRTRVTTSQIVEKKKKIKMEMTMVTMATIDIDRRMHLPNPLVFGNPAMVARVYEETLSLVSLLC